MPSLTKEGLIDGAKYAAANGMSFDEYCELITKVIVSGQTQEQVKAMLQSHGLDVYFDREGNQMFVSEIRSLYRDADDLFRTVIKRIYEEWDAALEQWAIQKVEYIFDDPPVPSDNVAVSLEHRHGWLVPPDWEFESEVWAYQRKPVDAVTYEHDSEVMVIK